MIIKSMIAIVLLLLLFAVSFFAYSSYANMKKATDSSTVKSNAKKLRSSNEIINQNKPFSVLLLGTDTGELGRTKENFEGARTDTMMIVTVNPKTNKTILNSIPRDSSVILSGYESQGIQKINSAYDYGGAKTTIDTIQNWTGIPIDFYAIVNMKGLTKLVDELGGVQVKSPSTFTFSQATAKSIGKDLYHFKKDSTEFTYSKIGDNSDIIKKDTMSGKDALAFTRMRYQDVRGDYGRQERQRLVIEAIAKKAMMNPNKTLSVEFMKTLSKNYRSNMSLGDATAVISKYSLALKNISQTDVPLEGKSGKNQDGSMLEYMSPESKDAFSENIAKQLGIKIHAHTDFGGSGYIDLNQDGTLSLHEGQSDDSHSIDQDKTISGLSGQ